MKRIAFQASVKYSWMARTMPFAQSLNRWRTFANRIGVERSSGRQMPEGQGLCLGRRCELRTATGDCEVRTALTAATATSSFPRRMPNHLSRERLVELLEAARRHARGNRRRCHARRLPARGRGAHFARGAGAGGARPRAQATRWAARRTWRRTSRRLGAAPRLVAAVGATPPAHGCVPCSTQIGAERDRAGRGRPPDDDEDAHPGPRRSRSYGSTRRRTRTCLRPTRRDRRGCRRRVATMPTRWCSRTTTRAC